MIKKSFVFICKIATFLETSKHPIIHEEFHSFTKGSIALLIELLRENKVLHLKFEETKDVCVKLLVD